MFQTYEWDYILPVIKKSFQPKVLAYSHYHIATSYMAKFDESADIKSYLTILRNLLQAKYVCDYNDIPPTDLMTLINESAKLGSLNREIVEGMINSRHIGLSLMHASNIGPMRYLLSTLQADVYRQVVNIQAVESKVTMRELNVLFKHIIPWRIYNE